MTARSAQTFGALTGRRGTWLTVIAFALSPGVLSCGTFTDPSAQSVAGTWTGTYRVVTCRTGPPGCVGLRNSYAIRVLLSQTDDDVTGNVRADVPAGTINGALPVSGSMDSSDTLHLIGSQPYIGSSDRPYQPGVAIDDWVTTLGSSATSMTGRFELTLQFRTNNLYPDIWIIEAELISLRR